MDPRLAAGRAAFALDRAVNAACESLSPREWTLIIRALDGEDLDDPVQLVAVRLRALDAPPQAVRWQKRILANERRWWITDNHGGH